LDSRPSPSANILSRTAATAPETPDFSQVSKGFARVERTPETRVTPLFGL
jgi:hypothetical protein